MGSATPPLPYPTVARLDNAQATVGSVRLNGRPVLVLDQNRQPHCVGDAPGVAKGVRSGTVHGEVRPVQGSNTVRAGKHAVIRMGDPCTMQGGAARAPRGRTASRACPAWTMDRRSA